MRRDRLYRLMVTVQAPRQSVGQEVRSRPQSGGPDSEEAVVTEMPPAHQAAGLPRARVAVRLVAQLVRRTWLLGPARPAGAPGPPPT